MKYLIKSITRREWLFLIIISLITVIITAAPYLYGYLTKPSGSTYVGVHHLTPGDTNVWLSMIEQTKQGHNIFINLYTSEPQNRIYTNPLWLSIGWLAKIFNLSNLLALHVSRSLWIILFIIVIYIFLCYFFKEVLKRKIILLIILFSSGLGLFFNPFLFNLKRIIEHPVDTWVPESITFLTLYHTPHITASLTLIVFTFLLMLMALDNNKVIYSILAGLASLLLFWFHPFNLPTIYLVTGIFILIKFVLSGRIIWSYIKHYLLLIIISLPSIFYLFWMAKTDWVIRNWSAQNILPSPSFWMYLIGYGLLWLLALIAIVKIFKNLQQKEFFLYAWLVTSLFLIYIPLNFQRRMVEGLHIPLTIFAGLGILYILDYLKKPRFQGKKVINSLPILLVISSIVFLPLTNIQILAQDFYLYSTKKTLPYYLSKGQTESFDWIKNNVLINEIIISSYYMGNYIPAYTGRIVYIGHGPQTINWTKKLEIIDWFFKDDQNDEGKYKFLKENKISYLYYSEKEKEIGDYSPAKRGYLQEVFNNNEVKIYRVL